MTLCTFSLVELYPSIPNKERQEDIRKTSNHFDGQFRCFGRVCFEDNIFEHNTIHFEELHVFMGYLEDKILKYFFEKALAWCRCIDDVFVIWQQWEEKLNFI